MRSAMPGRLFTVPVSRNILNSLLIPRFVKLLRKLVCQPRRCIPFKYKFCIKILSSSLNIMLIVVKHCSDASVVTNFRCHKLIAKVNKQKNSDMENFICNAVWRKICYFKHRKYQNLWMNNKGRGD